MSDCNRDYYSVIGETLPLKVADTRTAAFFVKMNTSTGEIHTSYQRANKNIVRMDERGSHIDYLNMEFSVYDGTYDQIRSFVLIIPVTHAYGHETIDNKGVGWRNHTGRITTTFTVGDANNFEVIPMNSIE